MFFFVKKLNLYRWLGLGGKPVRAKKPAGWSVTKGPYGEEVHAELMQCCHCRHSFEVIRGSGRLRGWCYGCNAVTCGSQFCMNCVPFEQQLANREKGLPALTPRAPQASVPAEPPKSLILPEW